MAIPTLAFVLSAIVFAPLCSWLAMRRQRSWVAWFCFGAIIGPVAAAILWFAPPGRCPTCGTPTRGWPRTCATCHAVFEPGLTTTRPPTPVESDTVVAAPLPADAATRPTWTSAPWTAATGSTGATASPGSPAAAGSAVSTATPTPTAIAASTASPALMPPSPRSGPADSDGDVHQSTTLGSGVYVGGSLPLQIGSRYLLALADGELQALGPVHLSPTTIAARFALAESSATVVGDRLVITGPGPRDRRSIAFSGVALAPGVDLDRTLEGLTRAELPS